jgi:hypothetical protein
LGILGVALRSLLTSAEVRADTGDAPRVNGLAPAPVASRGGWRRRGLAALLGALATAALPPVDAVPLLWLAFPGLLASRGPIRVPKM